MKISERKSSSWQECQTSSQLGTLVSPHPTDMVARNRIRRYVCTNNPGPIRTTLSTSTQQILIVNYISWHHHKLKKQRVTPTYNVLLPLVHVYVHMYIRMDGQMYTHTLLCSYCTNDYSSHQTSILNLVSSFPHRITKLDWQSSSSDTTRYKHCTAHFHPPRGMYICM